MIGLPVLRAAIAAHPWKTLAIASTLGACAALSRSRSIASRSLAEAVIGLSFGMLRDLASAGLASARPVHAVGSHN